MTSKNRMKTIKSKEIQEYSSRSSRSRSRSRSRGRSRGRSRSRSRSIRMSRCLGLGGVGD